MTSRLFRMRRPVAGLLLLGLLAVTVPSVFAQQKQYVTTTLRGRLTEAKGKPVAGAILRFTPVDASQATVVDAMTDVAGAFEASGLVFTNYVIEIETASGETIKGLNELPLREDERLEVELTVSPRVVSSTNLENQPQRFVAVVDKKKGKWKRFWKQFAIYIGVAAAAGTAAEGG